MGQLCHVDIKGTFFPPQPFSITVDILIPGHTDLPGKLMKVLLGGELLSEMVKGTV